MPESSGAQLRESSPLRVRGCVLAGGSGSRLGGAKPLAELSGRPLIEHALRALADAGLAPVVIAKRDSPLPRLGVEVVREAAVPVHPLAGIVCALETIGGPILVCACDMPFVSAALARRVAEIDEPAVVPEAAGRLQPLFARYAPAVLEPLRDALGARRALTAAVEGLRPRVLGEAELRDLGDPARLLANVNTPAELAAAEAAISS